MTKFCFFLVREACRVEKRSGVFINQNEVTSKGWNKLVEFRVLTDRLWKTKCPNQSLQKVLETEKKWRTPRQTTISMQQQHASRSCRKVPNSSCWSVTAKSKFSLFSQLSATPGSVANQQLHFAVAELLGMAIAARASRLLQYGGLIRPLIGFEKRNFFCP